MTIFLKRDLSAKFISLLGNCFWREGFEGAFGPEQRGAKGGWSVCFSEKAMLVRLLRKQTSMPLEWIAKEFTVGVRSSVS
jgi:hypothetical protein